tara:strand:- start:350 stop:550 length:201 start_codon:yes stop_codon:yes gene_type:complete
VNSFEALRLMRENLVNELMEVVESHRTEVGGGMSASDVIGALEFAKMEVYKEAVGEHILSDTPYAL